MNSTSSVAHAFRDCSRFPLSSNRHGASAVLRNWACPSPPTGRGTKQCGDVFCRQADRCKCRNIPLVFSHLHHDVADANSVVFQTRRDVGGDVLSACVRTLESRHGLGPRAQIRPSGDGCSEIAMPSAPRRSVAFYDFNFISDPVVVACSVSSRD